MKLSPLPRRRTMFSVVGVSAIAIAVCAPAALANTDSARVASAPARINRSHDDAGKVAAVNAWEAKQLAKAVTAQRARLAKQRIQARRAGKALVDWNVTLDSTSYMSITPPGGSTANLKAHGYSYVTTPTLETSATFNNSSSEVSWLGSSPFNATRVTLSENWHCDGVSVSVSVPLGASFSGSGSDANDSASAASNWHISNGVSQIYFHAFDIYRVHHTVSGKFQFGSTFYRTVSTHDSDLV